MLLMVQISWTIRLLHENYNLNKRYNDYHWAYVVFAYVIRVYVPFILLLRNMQKYNILELNEKLLPELQSIAEELGIKKSKFP